MKNSEIAQIIDEYVHNEKHRQMLKRRWIDGITFEELAYEFEFSVTQVKRIIHKYDKLLDKMV